MKRPTILIIDNSVNDLNEIEALINEFNVELVKAGSIEEVHDWMNRVNVVMVIIGIGIETNEGFKIAESIRRDKTHEHLNILYISDACCETYQDKDYLFTGSVDFITRPFITGILRGKVENAINQYYQRTQLAREIEERKVVEAKLFKEKKIEEEATRSKIQFLSTMSHEIRTPLNAIINTINLLITEDPRLDQLDDMNVLRFSAENLLKLINEILDYSKIDADKIEFEEIDFNIRKLISGIKQSLQYGMVKEGTKLDCYIEEKVPAFIVGDSVRLAQIFFNLVGNALKFTEKGKVTLTAEVFQELEDKIELKFIISDTGIGIPEDKQKDIFEAFTQATTSTTRKYGGTGLGLAITRMLIEKQGGRIELKSKPKEGSTFSVYLTFKRSTKVLAEELQGSAQIHSLEGINVLVVEDNEINQNIVTRLLKKWNAVTDTAENGKIAVQKVMEKQYQLVLMDLHMPEMNGYDAARQIRGMEGEYYKKLPILAVTASVFADDRRKICAAGMNGYVLKPFHPVELNSKISHFLNHKTPIV
jgi:signal transduction histidine kinase/CheY-like chemotaxis protein